MRLRIIGVAVLGTILLLGLGTRHVDAQSRIMPFAEIKPGMEGIGKTVVKGDEIRTFNVKVVNVIDNPGMLNDHIVVRLSGAAIRQSGGVAAGMSGSPIYFNDKLAGALWGAWGFQVGAEPIALVRPIEAMLALVEPLKKKELDRRNRTAQLPQGSSVEIQRKQKVPSEQAPETIFIQPATTPLLVSGLSGRTLSYLKNGLSEWLMRSAGMRRALVALNQEDFINELSQGLEERYAICVQPTGLSGAAAHASAYTNRAIPLAEGGPLGVMLADGDVTIGAFGTVSYVEDNIVLAFGHWFFPAGETEFFLAEAYILDTVESLEFPFKLGVPGRTLGAILEDRWQGVGGIAELEPRSLEVTLSAKDKDLKVMNKVNFRIAYYESLIPLLLLLGALDTVDRTINRVGPGTMVARYTVYGNALPKPLARTDVFASFSDIAVTGPLRIAQMLFTLARNEFTDAQLNRLDIEMEVQQAVRALRVKSLKTNKEKYKPGETVKYTVTLKPYRGEEQTVEGELQLPAKLDRSSVTLLAFGGPRRSEKDSQEAPEFDSLEELMDELGNLAANNRLTVEFLNLASAESPEEKAEKFQQTKTLDETVVYGEKTLEITIESEEPEKPKEPEPKKKPCPYLFYCP